MKDGLILTNRHVLQELARQRDAGKWEFKGEPTITFDADPEKSRERQFKIGKVVLAGPDEINPAAVDYNKLDFAILECEVDRREGLPRAPGSRERRRQDRRGAARLHPRLPGAPGIQHL